MIWYDMACYDMLWQVMTWHGMHCIESYARWRFPQPILAIYQDRIFYYNTRLCMLMKHRQQCLIIYQIFLMRFSDFDKKLNHCWYLETNWKNQ